MFLEILSFGNILLVCTLLIWCNLFHSCWVTMGDIPGNRSKNHHFYLHLHFAYSTTFYRSVYYRYQVQYYHYYRVYVQEDLSIAIICLCKEWIIWNLLLPQQRLRRSECTAISWVIQDVNFWLYTFSLNHQKTPWKVPLLLSRALTNCTSSSSSSLRQHTKQVWCKILYY